MLEFEGKLIFHELHPNMIPNPDDVEDGEEDAGSYPIKFSDTWQRKKMKRHHFSFRKLETKMNYRDSLS